MDISRFKLVVKFVFGGPTAAVDYVLDVANTFVNRLAETHDAEIDKALATATKILSTLGAIAWLVPSKWSSAYSLTVGAFADLVDALSDKKIERSEIGSVATAFRLAYSAWRAD